MLLFWLLGPYAADAAINLCNCVYLCLLWPYTTSPARGVCHGHGASVLQALLLGSGKHIHIILNVIWRRLGG